VKIESFLTGPSRGLLGVPGILQREGPRRGRPRRRIRLVLNSPKDVEAARHHGVPVYLLTSELVMGLGYPVEFPPHLLVAREVEHAIDSPLPRIVLEALEAVESPGIEDVVAALLRIDPLAARGVAARNRPSVSADQLLRRVVQLQAEAEATWVNLQEFAPAIPSVGTSLPAEWLREQNLSPRVEGLRA
jgi:hypothetical protein